VSFVKEWGAATPQFQQAMITNETFRSVLFEFLKVNDNGEEYVFHTIQLGTALITEIQQYIDPANTPGITWGQSGDTGPLEKISFNFQRIEITNIDGQTTAVDELRAVRDAPDPG
jgi:type VI secretion system secreted protein Hcp